ncbi:uncharacterized protein LOC133849752 [Drosophila sulfurigaster albostrigata]|uniref:uncharacterized protein LOC133849752 n=1 Tax=Drosophila sulfurigaster albostrigata TaxID=89887 RepID=UPI002D21E8D6|nr:uncharacterized protein LOC133849752 [Drosophila sulfurigaster albostrigata]
MEHQRNIPESPEWLDQHLFVEFLKQDIPNFKNIDQFVIEETCAKGENFTTLVLRVKFVVNIEDDSQVSASYIVKLLPTTLSTRDMIASWKVLIRRSFHIASMCYILRKCMQRPIKN